MQLKFSGVLMDRPIKTSHTLLHCDPVSHQPAAGSRPEQTRRVLSVFTYRAET